MDVRVLAGPGWHRRDGGELRVEHDLVERPLGRGEATVHRERARDVGGVVAELARGVDEEQVAVLHAPSVLVVVQDAGVRPRRHDARVAVPGRAPARNTNSMRGLHLVLVHARLGEAHGLGVRVAADLAARRCRVSSAGDRRSRISAMIGLGIVDARGRRRTRASRTPRRCSSSRMTLPSNARLAQPVEQRGPVDRELAQLVVELVRPDVRGVRAVGRRWRPPRRRARPFQISISRSRGRTKST